MGISEEAVSKWIGDSASVSSIRPVFGGDINSSFAISLSDGREFFIKTNRRDALPMFREEEAGLKAMAQTGTIRVPKTIGTGVANEGAYLLMEFIKEGRRSGDFWEGFAHRLAAMHSSDTSAFTQGKGFGFLIDNTIGATKQINTPCDSFIKLFTEYRLKVQFDMADSYFSVSDKRKIEKLLSKLPELLVEPSRPALIHGDLWSGNFITGDDGQAMLIDPAVYVGHPEADIAMTELFGGFDRRFYAAYKETGLLAYGYDDRRDLYNLYHLLTHLNLFGPSYYTSVMRTISGYV